VLVPVLVNYCLQNLKGSDDMDNYAILRNAGEFTIFGFGGHVIRFVTSLKLERYTKVLEWDHGYLVAMAKYKKLDEMEEYIDLLPILQNLYYDVDTFLNPIKKVRVEYGNSISK
jgi:hypothetical protein